MTIDSRVRFAPSPTGQMHVGNARTALFNWLFARKNEGRFVLRIEDTDQERSLKVYEQSLLENLKWLGLDWDEGPEKGGDYGPYHQIERLHLYQSYLDKLIAEDKVYPCYCSEEELEQSRSMLLSMRKTPRYTGKCRNLSEQERKKLEAEGRKPAIRFKVEPGPIEFYDLIRGAMKFEGEALGDFIIVRSSGVPAYNLAVVIDDHLMKMTHVIRGEDHLSNTAIQILLYRAFGFEIPVYAHHSLLLGKDHTKLSKRHGSVSIREFMEKGILPEALVNYLALLGSSFDEGREIVSLQEMINAFSLDRAGKSGAVFDEDKLRWLNAIYIRNDDIDRLTGRIIPFIEKAGFDAKTLDHVWLCRVVEAVRENLVTLSDIGGYLDMFLDETYRFSEEAEAVCSSKAGLSVVRALYESLNRRDVEDGNLYASLIKEVKETTGRKGKELFLPIRAAVTGRIAGPELDKMFLLLAKTSILKRLKQAINVVESNGSEAG
jgi:nondiscriminating glutamyl-tRNA synthetase